MKFSLLSESFQRACFQRSCFWRACLRRAFRELLKNFQITFKKCQPDFIRSFFATMDTLGCSGISTISANNYPLLCIWRKKKLSKILVLRKGWRFLLRSPKASQPLSPLCGDIWRLHWTSGSSVVLVFLLQSKAFYPFSPSLFSLSFCNFHWIHWAFIHMLLIELYQVKCYACWVFLLRSKE